MAARLCFLLSANLRCISSGLMASALRTSSCFSASVKLSSSISRIFHTRSAHTASSDSGQPRLSIATSSSRKEKY
jgi:hypothetical protein